MGLLTNPKTRAKLISIISRFCNPLCFLCYVVGVCWFFALAYRPLNAGTYFSENALLPGLVVTDFDQEHGASDYLSELKATVKKLPADSEESYRLPTSWIVEQFEKNDLDTYVQNFTFKYPVNILNGKAFSGQNVYGIIRAPRASSTEAVVINIPYRPPETDKDRTHAGVAMALSLAKSFKRRSYWAKDIIFLVTEFEGIGIHAWLSAYHHTSSGYITPGELHGRGGAIQAALSLEMGSSNFHRIDVRLEGLNGQLPNLDLVNTVSQLCRRESIPLTLQDRLNPGGHGESYKNLQHSLMTMLRMIGKQASGVPTGNHGYFHRYQIEAVTLHTRTLSSSNKKMYSFLELGRVIEGVSRSLNNLLERFHQSFFFYLMPSTDRYVSIGLYMPPFGVLAAPILIKALALWIQYSLLNTNGKSEKDGKNSEQNSTRKETETNDNDIWGVLPMCVMAVFFALAAYAGPTHFIPTAQPFHMQPDDSLMWGTVALLFSSCLFPYLLKRKSASRGSSSDVNPTLLKCLSLLLLAMVLASTALLNFSLAIIVAIVWCPVAVVINSCYNRVLRVFQYLLLLLVNPLALLYYGCIMYHYNTSSFLSGTNLGALHLEAWESTKHALLLAVLNSYLYESWIYTIVATGFFPVWVMMWALVWSKPVDNGVKNEGNVESTQLKDKEHSGERNGEQNGEQNDDSGANSDEDNELRKRK